MPKLSFVIPLYNKEAYISSCISSLRTQTMKDIEVIIVNDCSSDDSLEIAQWHADLDKRIKIIDLKENGGRSNARNVGNKAVSSPIVCVQDADDISGLNRAEMTLKAFKDKDVDIVYGNYYKIQGTDQYLIRSKPFNIEEVKEKLYTFIGHSTMGYRKSVLDKISYQEGEWSDLGIDDWRFQMDAYYRGFKFKYLDKPLSIYVESGNAISKNRDEKEVKKAKEKYLKEKSLEV